MLDATPPAERGSSNHGAAPFVALLLFLIATTAAAFALQPARAAGPAASPSADVVLIGDSITDQARDQLVTALAPATVQVEATAGRTIDEQQGAARSAAAASPDHVVVNLGSNDVLLDERPARSQAALRELVAALPPSTCVHLVTVSEWFFAIFPDSIVLRERARAINDEIRRLAAADGHDVIDWAAVTEAAYEADPPVSLTSDTVHPNDAGKARLVELYREGIARGCR
jgi:lysophospholipase L1-like esterase